MTRRQTVWLGMIVGSAVGGLVPMLWGAGMFSMSGVIFTAIGGFFGIWAAFKLY